MGLRVREAVPRDVLELVELRRKVVAEGRWFIGTAEEQTWTVDRWDQLTADLRGSELGTLRVARMDGALVGFVLLRAPAWRRTRHAVKLEIAVAESTRGRGIGRALMDDALAWAIASPVVEKVGLVVFSDNDRAIALYRACGFVEEGRREREYKLEDGSYRGDLLLYRFV